MKTTVACGTPLARATTRTENSGEQAEYLDGDAYHEECDDKAQHCAITLCILSYGAVFVVGA